MNKKRLIILGCTGSIGTSALDIVRSYPERYEIVALSAHTKKNELHALAEEFLLEENRIALSGENAQSVYDIIRHTDCDIVLNGIAGSSGLQPSVVTLECGKNLALANKETIVMAGSLIKKLASKNNCAILPVDSEHSAVFNLIEKFGHDAVSEIILTASGGPFRTWTADRIQKATVSDALAHPTWNMGHKITIDSASLANKGLEVIEACYLFDMDVERIKVTVHPQSVVHSLIRTKDGQLYAQMSKPDMKHPIICAFEYPLFLENTLESLTFDSSFDISFYPPRFDDFPLLRLAYTSAAKKASYPIAYNAANEVAVDSFLRGGIAFSAISAIVSEVLQHDWTFDCVVFDEVYERDIHARNVAKQVLQRKYCYHT